MFYIVDSLPKVCYDNFIMKNNNKIQINLYRNGLDCTWKGTTPEGHVEFCSRIMNRLNPSLATATKARLTLAQFKDRGFIPVELIKPFSCWQWSVPTCGLTNDDGQCDYFFSHEDTTTSKIVERLTNTELPRIVTTVTVWFKLALRK